MSLPKIKHPLVTVTVPSTGKKVKMRPFTVKEEKILLLAREETTNGNLDGIIEAIKQLFVNCIVDPIDPNTLTLYDFEYLFIKMRALSVDNEVTFQVRDDHGKYVIVDCNLDDIKIEQAKGNVIDLGGGVSVTLSPVKINDIAKLDEVLKGDDNDALIAVLKLIIVNIFDDDKVYTRNDDFDDKELEDFIVNLSTKARNKIVEYLQDSPRLRHTVTYKDSEGKEQSLELVGLADFFTLSPPTSTSPPTTT